MQHKYCSTNLHKEVLLYLYSPISFSQPGANIICLPHPTNNASSQENTQLKMLCFIPLRKKRNGTQILFKKFTQRSTFVPISYNIYLPLVLYLSIYLISFFSPSLSVSTNLSSTPSLSFFGLFIPLFALFISLYL